MLATNRAIIVLVVLLAGSGTFGQAQVNLPIVKTKEGRASTFEVNSDGCLVTLQVFPTRGQLDEGELAVGIRCDSALSAVPSLLARLLAAADHDRPCSTHLPHVQVGFYNSPRFTERMVELGLKHHLRRRSDFATKTASLLKNAPAIVGEIYDGFERYGRKLVVSEVDQVHYFPMREVRDLHKHSLAKTIPGGRLVLVNADFMFYQRGADYRALPTCRRAK